MGLLAKLQTKFGRSPAPTADEPFVRERAMIGQPGDRAVRTSCPAHNCGGRCLLVAHIKDGVITRLDSDDRTHDDIDEPRLLACARGKSCLRRQYHPDRLKYPIETKSDYRICAEIAERLGIGPEYTEGWDERGWVAHLLDTYRAKRFPDVPDLDEFEASNIGVYSVKVTEPDVAFADFRADPEKHPLPTPSGKIEIFSKELYDMGRPDDIPAVPASGPAPTARHSSTRPPAL